MYFVAAALVACGVRDTGDPQPELPMRDVDVGGTPLRVEVADDPMERERGLTFRRSIRRDHGMLFVFPDAFR